MDNTNIGKLLFESVTKLHCTSYPDYPVLHTVLHLITNLTVKQRTQEAAPSFESVWSYYRGPLSQSVLLCPVGRLFH